MNTSATDKAEKSMAQLVIIIAMVSILMAVFIYYFFKQEASFTDTNFTALKNSFVTRVTVARAQWMMDNQPESMVVSVNDEDGKQIEDIRLTMNKRGWIDSPNAKQPCEAIWQMAMGTPLRLMKSTISAVELQGVDKQGFSYCRYIVPSGQFFDYNAASGRVSEIQRS